MSEPEPAAGPAEEPTEPGALPAPTTPTAEATQNLAVTEESAGEPTELTAFPAFPAFTAEETQSPVEATQSAESPAEVTQGLAVTEEAAGPSPGSVVRRARLAFRGWRRGRPFWGGLIVALGATEILITYQAPFGILVHFGLYGLAGYLVPILLALLGVLIIFDPAHRTFYSVLSVLAALGTWLTSNLGGFFIGMLLGVVGGSLAFGWQYGERPERAQRGRRRRPRVRTRAAE